jgi:hypothetical protein
MTAHDAADSNSAVQIPAPLGDQLQRVQGLADPPRTLTEWGAAIGDIVREEDIEVGLQALCTTDESPHRASFDGRTQHFVCVQDAFIVPAVVDGADTVAIETESPVSGDPISIEVDGDDVTTDPPDAVMSVGVEANPADDAVAGDARSLSYGMICPYGHAFVDREEYAQWAETVDAHTMVAPLTGALRLARAIEAATR